ncbi:MAG: hypothetical protein U0V73_05060 [Acidimicrobiia bacterium]
MRRPPHGGTTHPILSRPGNGFGRPASHAPGPLYATVTAPELEVEWFLHPEAAPSPTLVGPERRPVLDLTDDRP